MQAPFTKLSILLPIAALWACQSNAPNEASPVGEPANEAGDMSNGISNGITGAGNGGADMMPSVGSPGTAGSSPLEAGPRNESNIEATAGNDGGNAGSE
jgi:hypothetical protein